MPSKKCSRLMPLLESTKLCKFHAAGKCNRGETCTYAHSTEQVREQPNFCKTRLCAVFKRSGRCTQGAECKFAHGNGDRRLRLPRQALCAERNPATGSITSKVQTSGASEMDSSAHEQPARPEISEIDTRLAVEQDAPSFVHEVSAHATSARNLFADGNGCFDHGEVSLTSNTQAVWGFAVKNTFIEFADERPITTRRSSSLPAKLGIGACRPA
eukprot:TRINITY_DN7455_c0_g2_i1.p1 TRINITY_DN7455_c0_g2~~TRINITY_DN7455_c0_g2_i1.p1  ORF type:complete len:214 (+),score=26.83 TRINITY_DN7455_c0_g2_i1:118-759(+)